MLAGVRNFIIQQGSTWDPVMTWKSDGTPVNLTGYGARLQGRLPLGGDIVQPFDLSSTGGTIILGGALGTFQPVVTAAQTSAIVVPSGAQTYTIEDENEEYSRTLYILAEYDLEFFIGAYVTRLLQGYFLFSAEVTR